VSGVLPVILSAAHGLRVTLLERRPGCHPERLAVILSAWLSS